MVAETWNARRDETTGQTETSVEPAGSGTRTEEIYRTYTQLDRLGRVVAFYDPRGVACATWQYDDLGRVLTQQSVDQGAGAMLPDALGQPVRSGRGTPDGEGVVPFHTRQDYDALRRPTTTWLSVAGSTEVLRHWIQYGEDKDDAQETYHRGQAWRVHDTAGRVEVTSYHFLGQPLTSHRRVVADVTTDTEWADAAAVAGDETDYDDACDLLLESAVQASVLTYDALGRVVTSQTPDSSMQTHTYDEGGALREVSLLLRGVGSPTTVFDQQTYNARGQRLSQRAQGIVRTWTYDPLTFRITKVVVVRSSDEAVLQDLRYTYDPVGNVLEVRDRAQQTVYFANDVVSPTLRHTYDAAYRLVRTEGRELAALGADAEDWRGEAPRQNLPHVNDSSAIYRYVQTFTFDPNGNLLTQKHWVPMASGLGYTRQFAYASDSNRLLTTTVGGGTPAPITHDQFGQMTAFLGMHNALWDAAGRLRRTQVLPSGTAERTWYVYDAGGQRVRKQRQTWDAIAEQWVVAAQTDYHAGLDVVRAFVGGTLDDERETLHVSDGSAGSGGTGRLLLVETRTVHEGDPVPSPTSQFRTQLDNHLGSATLELTPTGDVLSYEEFHPWGTTAYRSGADEYVSTKRYRYSGKERDAETGLYYYGARYLAPWLGRWISTDPAGFVDGPNVYAFVRGRPSTGWDGDGRESVPVKDTTKQQRPFARLQEMSEGSGTPETEEEQPNTQSNAPSRPSAAPGPASAARVNMLILGVPDWDLRPIQRETTQIVQDALGTRAVTVVASSEYNSLTAEQQQTIAQFVDNWASDGDTFAQFRARAPEHGYFRADRWGGTVVGGVVLIEIPPPSVAPWQEVLVNELVHVLAIDESKQTTHHFESEIASTVAQMAYRHRDSIDWRDLALTDTLEFFRQYADAYVGDDSESRLLSTSGLTEAGSRAADRILSAIAQEVTGTPMADPDAARLPSITTVFAGVKSYLRALR